MVFTHKKVSALSGRTEVRYTEHRPTESGAATAPTGFTIIADITGVRFDGLSGVIGSQRELEVFAQAVSDAWIAHRKLLSAAIDTTTKLYN